jgi:hypothetical protein
MEVICYSETSGYLRSTWRYYPKARNLHNHRSEKLKFNILTAGTELEMKLLKSGENAHWDAACAIFFPPAGDPFKFIEEAHG